MTLVFPKKRRFFFHYNKPQSRLAGEPRLSLHFNNQCYIIKGVNCQVQTETKNNKKQPFCVVQGKAARFDFINGTVLIR